MAVGKGSMARASKAAAGKAAETPKETTTVSKAETTAKAEPAAKEASEHKTAAAKSTTTAKRATTKKTPAKKTVKKDVIAAPKKEVMDTVVYRQSSGVLDRDAMQNETFGIGDAIPIYFL